MIAADEMDVGAGRPDPVQSLEDGFIPPQPEVGVVEPEIENVAQKDQVVCRAGQIHQLTEALDPADLRCVGMQVEVGIGHKEGTGLCLRV